MGIFKTIFWTKALKPFGHRAADFLFPPVCVGCGVHVSHNATLCPNCWQKISFITKPYCPVMGIPFQYDQGNGFLSGEVIAHPPRFDHARSAVIHDHLARRLVTRLKYGDRIDLAPMMAGWMGNVAQDLIMQADLIIPVPLHRWRFIARQYNQAAELARLIAKHHHRRFCPEALWRIRPTKHQVGLQQSARLRNVKGAFSVPSKSLAKIKGKNILLIDDVYTTGATVNDAARALKKAGAAMVNVLTFSRALQHTTQTDV